MRLIISLILAAACLCACSPEKRLARLVRKHPELVKADTIFRTDTTVVDGVMRDTVFRTQITRDTLVIKDKQLTIKYYNDGTTTYLKGVCDTVRVIKEIPVIVNTVQPVETVRDWWLIIALAAISVLMFILLVKKK